MKDRMTVRHGMLDDLEAYLKRKNWRIEPTKGEYEVLRARHPKRKTPLLVHNRTTGGCGYSINEHDIDVYRTWKKDRRKRGLDPDWPTESERKGYWEGRTR